jgi:hypothetical protein
MDFVNPDASLGSEYEETFSEWGERVCREVSTEEAESEGKGKEVVRDEPEDEGKGKGKQPEKEESSSK